MYFTLETISASFFENLESIEASTLTKRLTALDVVDLSIKNLLYNCNDCLLKTCNTNVFYLQYWIEKSTQNFDIFIFS